MITVGPEKAELLVSPFTTMMAVYIGPMVTWEVITDKLAMEEKNRDYTNQIAADQRRPGGDRIQNGRHGRRSERQLPESRRL